MSTYEKILFKEEPINVKIDETGKADFICLNQILLLVKREVMIKNGKAITKCPSSYIFRKQIYASLPETLHLVQDIQKESKVIAGICDEVIEWLKELYTKPVVVLVEAEEVPEEPVEDIKLEYDDREFTARHKNGRLFFNATQMARPYDKYPSLWLNLKSTRELREALVKEGKFPDVDSQVDSNRGAHGATWFDMELVVPYAQWLKPEFAVFCNEAIFALMQNGSVTVEELSQKKLATMPVRMLPFAALSKPDTLEEALAVIDRANEMLSEAQGHREVYDRFVGHRTCFHTQHIALELNTTANILNKFLTEEGIQEKTRKGWVLRNGYRHLKANIPDDWINPLSKAVRHNTNYAWTPDAREYIIDLWYEKHNIAR